MAGGTEEGPFRHKPARARQGRWLRGGTGAPHLCSPRVSSGLRQRVGNAGTQGPAGGPSPDILGGVPPLRGQLPTLGVVDRRVENGDAHIPRLSGDREEGSLSTLAPGGPHSAPRHPLTERAHLVDVGVPHLGQETKSRRGIGVVDGELEACLWGGQRRSAQMGPAVCSAPRVGTGWPAQAAAPTAPTSTRKRPSAWEGRPRHGQAAQRAGAVRTLARNTTHQPRPSRAWPGAGRLPGGRLSWLGSVGACPGRSSGPECGPGL